MTKWGQRRTNLQIGPQRVLQAWLQDRLCLNSFLWLTRSPTRSSCVLNAQVVNAMGESFGQAESKSQGDQKDPKHTLTLPRSAAAFEVGRRPAEHTQTAPFGLSLMVTTRPRSAQGSQEVLGLPKNKQGRKRSSRQQGRGAQDCSPPVCSGAGLDWGTVSCWGPAGVWGTNLELWLGR